MARHTNKVPAWLAGLILALVIFVAVALLLNVLGYGDDPVVEGLSSLSG
jgi:hypothetical protein